MALWGGRFTGDSDVRFKHFNDSLRFDYRLFHEDVEGSRAWAESLKQVKVLSEQEYESLIRALNELEQEMTGREIEISCAGDEDIHSYVERRLIEKVGALGKKLHTGRSRNDQVALDLKLFCRNACGELMHAVRHLQRVILEAADKYQGTIFPGYTHLQRAQPVTFSHFLLAYLHMLDRDFVRLMNARNLLNVCPLGSAALAGTAYPVDREDLAHRLQFKDATHNSLDAVSDRDHVMELLSCASISMIHLSRLAEDLIIYNSGEAGFIELSDKVTSGSSLMPQKKNPDALELIRGKSGRVAGALAGMLMTVKALPLAYDKDLQEDKEGLFDALDTWHECLDMMALVFEDLKLNKERIEAAAKGGYSNATELADYLVSKGIPFREAHDLVGKIVLYAISVNKPLEELTTEEFRSVSPVIGEDVYPVLSLDSILAKRNITGGVAPERTAAEIEALKKVLCTDRE